MWDILKITTDRGSMNYCSMRLDILGYNVDEELPWHNTLSRTRHLFPEDVPSTVSEET